MADYQMTELCELARKHLTDKGGQHYHAGDTCHAYTPVYHEMLGHRRDKIKNVLEIGVNHGCSVVMWEEYFPNAHIIGLDSNGGCYRGPGHLGRVSVRMADQNNGADLDRETADVPEFDLIVDDGSHEFEHQVFSARHLLSRLAPDGLYVIEDIHMDCQPWQVTDAIMKDLTLPYPVEVLWVKCPPGWGKAKCGCGCGEVECLPVFHRIP